MLQDCTNLEAVKFFDSPIEKVTDMIAFFSSCRKMKNFSLDPSEFLKSGVSITKIS